MDNRDGDFAGPHDHSGEEDYCNVCGENPSNSRVACQFCGTIRNEWEDCHCEEAQEENP